MNRLIQSPFRAALPVALVACAALLGAGRAQAGTFTYNYTGAAVAIPDNNAAGTNLDINVTDTYSLASFQSVSITFSTPHTWAGDLIATLTNVSSGRTIDLFRRVGSTSTGGVGDSSALAGPYTFSNLLATGTNTRLVDGALAVGFGVNVASGTYRPTTNTFSGTNAGETITNLNTTFDGLSSVAGVWRLNISDNASGDTGTVGAFSITMNSPAAVVPETSTFALLGLALPVVGVVIRRKLGK